MGRLPIEAAKRVLFNASTPEQASWAAERLGPQPVAPFEQRVSVAAENADAFARLSRAYIVCRQDRAIPPAMQRRMLTETTSTQGRLIQIFQLDRQAPPVRS